MGRRSTTTCDFTDDESKGGFKLLSYVWLSICAASRPVENKLCQGPIPEMSQLCQIPCPVECEVSLWGAWGPCTFENCEDQAGTKGTETGLKEQSTIYESVVDTVSYLIEQA